GARWRAAEGGSSAPSSSTTERLVPVLLWFYCWTSIQKSWDLVEQTQNYLKLLLHIINSDDDSGLLVHCISGWDRTPLFVSLLRLSLWAVSPSSAPPSHMLPDRLSKGEEIFFFCFNFLKHIVSEKFSAVRKQRPFWLFSGSRDRGSITSLSSDFSLITEEPPANFGPSELFLSLTPGVCPSPPRCSLPSERQARLEAVREIFLAAYSSTVGLRSSAPSPSGAISGLLEQFARGVGLRGSNAIV
uniref:Myotubularin related protein 14 n=1 Tax=Cyprinodon variegatus TaxID=28743 RepID=A0A3Q2DAR9_CYPVA